MKRAKETGTDSPEKIEIFELQKKGIKEQVKLLVKEGHQIFDDKKRVKNGLVLPIPLNLIEKYKNHPK